MTTRTRIFLLLFVLLSLTAASWILWTSLTPRRVPLEAEWPAIVTVLAGDGVSGMRDGSSSLARFSDPFGVAAAADGTIYVADAGDAQRIRRIAPDGAVTSVAGSARGYRDGPAAQALFDTPSGIAIDAGGTLYLADTGNHAIRRISPDGTVSTLAGDGTAGYRDGQGRQARFNGPIGVAVDPAGRLIVADTYNDRIRAIQPDGTVTTIAGSGKPGYIDGAAGAAQFDTPCGVAVAPDGTIYVADSGNSALRAITAAGYVSTVSPSGNDGLRQPIGVAAAPDGMLYLSDARGRIVEVVPGVRARTISGSRPGFADGAGEAARFRAPAGIAVVAPGRLVAADRRNALLRLIAARSQVEARLPASPLIAPRFDAESFNLLPLWWPLDPMEGPFEITGTMGEARGGEGGERFHAGLDVSGDEGASVLALRDGIVSDPLSTAAFGTLSESMLVGPIAYIHLRVGRRSDNSLLDMPGLVASYDDAGRLERVRVRRGSRFGTGDRLGTLNAFNHAHINIGWPGEEINPLRFRLVQFEDSVPPTIAPFGVRLFGEDGQPLMEREGGRLLVAGRVRIVVDAWDQVDGNLPRRRLGLYSLGYQVLQPNGLPVAGFEPRETIVFDRFAGDEEAARVVFAPGSGIPFYGGRRTRFLYVATNSFRGGTASTGWWDTATLPPGEYTLRILAGDIRGNLALGNRDLPVTVAGG